jgi:hypothetical protein
MSEKLLKLLLSELKLVRVVCHGRVKQKDDTDLPCNGVFEMPLERLATAFCGDAKLAQWACPFCGQEYHLSSQRSTRLDPFGPLVDAITNLLSLRDRLEIEFVIPQKD